MSKGFQNMLMERALKKKLAKAMPGIHLLDIEQMKKSTTSELLTRHRDQLEKLFPPEIISTISRLPEATLNQPFHVALESSTVKQELTNLLRATCSNIGVEPDSELSIREFVNGRMIDLMMDGLDV